VCRMSLFIRCTFSPISNTPNHSAAAQSTEADGPQTSELSGPLNYSDVVTTTRRRIDALDALRGIVMILMALDHVRDMFHRAAMSFSPTDLTKTTMAIFFTRWVTHFCMPTFMFTAGAGAFLWWRQRQRTRVELSRFLVTRGAWFVLLELTVMQFSYNFNFSRQNMVLLLVLWIFGLCMILMSALIWIPLRILTGLCLSVIALHNLLDRVPIPVWLFLHQPGVFQLDGRSILVTYPLIPWVTVMGIGFCFGQVLLLEPERQRRLILRAGLGLSVAFVVLRAINLYGDPSPRGTGILSFLNCTKYPASLDYLLMTLGPALVLLSLLQGRTFSPRNPVIVFGRVPLFFFLIHFFLIHAALLIMCWVRYGNAVFAFIFHPVPSFGGPAGLFPPDFGFRLRAVYLVWLAMLALLDPLCVWYARFKGSRDYWWLKYL
jgi:uncharacterized membrane protein